ncbi:hypothetical protein GGF46_002079 [Coemansia sp. RSA 552]|nr:hypothetical protein GGF46_002079 [Coemansia sp. RSA 552]
MSLGLDDALALPTIPREVREEKLSKMLNIVVTNPDNDDVILIAVCSALFGLTGAMLVYAWCNYNYRPIRAKNLTWTTAIYVSAVLWFIGDLPLNQHVWIDGGWKVCRLWVIWFRIMGVYVFLSMTIVRLYALDRVFNQKKPFTRRNSLMAVIIVLVLNSGTCIIFTAVRIMSNYIPAFEACDASNTLRITALAIQWTLWFGVSILMFRLRNIQSSFNEFRESLIVFAAVICMVTETSVTNLLYTYYPFVKVHRIRKTLVDVITAMIVVWSFVAVPVFHSIFNRKKYEQMWLERLAKDGPGLPFQVPSNPNDTTAYTKMNDNMEMGYHSSQYNFGGSNMNDGYANSHRPFGDPDPLNIENALSGQVPYNDNLLPAALRNNAQIHKPVLNTPTMFSSGYMDPPSDGRHVL